MSIKEKIEQIKDKAARVAVKTAAVATLIGGSGAISSCAAGSENTDENKDKIENVGEKTSVVFKSKFGRFANHMLLENGDELSQDIVTKSKGAYLDVGDTVTYEGNNVKAVRYKGTPEVKKKVDFGKIGKIRDITD